ncbi:MAG: sulfite exporter TauE/SafE family protein [Chitinophagaceae bacterium]
MEIWLYVGVILLGLLAGILSGIFGIGGGIVIVPILILMNQDLLNANAISLLAMLLPVSIFGVIAYYKAGYINVSVATWLAVGLFMGSFIGAEIAIGVSKTWLGILYITYLLYVCLVYLDVINWIMRKPKIIENDKIEKHFKSIIPYFLIGFFSGIIAGMFGKGGGLLIVFFLTQFLNYKHKTATAISLAAMLLPVGLPAVILYAQKGYLNYPYYEYASIIAIGIVVGTFFGSKIAIKLPAHFFKKAYAIFLLCVSIYLTIEML